MAFIMIVFLSFTGSITLKSYDHRTVLKYSGKIFLFTLKKFNIFSFLFVYYNISILPPQRKPCFRSIDKIQIIFFIYCFKFGIRVSLQKFFRLFGFIVPLKLVGEQFSVSFFNIVNFLLIVCSPKVPISVSVFVRTAFYHFRKNKILP